MAREDIAITQLHYRLLGADEGIALIEGGFVPS